ncbi:hypothetical protein GBA52_028845 [Prunus armeniaca]|nr:hypothetical protein GBA52_028845 [Prunus armeniaca]
MSEIEIELEDILLAKQRFEAIKKQHEFQEFLKMDQKSLEEKSSLSQEDRNKLNGLNAVLVHSESVKRSTWLLFRDQLQTLMRSSRIGMVQELTEPKSAEDLDVVDNTGATN